MQQLKAELEHGIEETLLMFAIKNGNVEMAEYLIDNAANVNYMTKRREQALDFALAVEVFKGTNALKKLEEQTVGRG